jgi:triphosphoribosyl-dephospho-CoA synthetase
MTNSEFQEELTRAFLLALSIEPLAEKRGCTTRKVDASPGTKLEYFIVSAVNSYPSFTVLINRILDLKKQPECIFDIAHDA